MQERLKCQSVLIKNLHKSDEIDVICFAERIIGA